MDMTDMTTKLGVVLLAVAFAVGGVAAEDDPNVDIIQPDAEDEFILGPSDSFEAEADFMNMGDDWENVTYTVMFQEDIEDDGTEDVDPNTHTHVDAEDVENTSEDKSFVDDIPRSHLDGALDDESALDYSEYGVEMVVQMTYDTDTESDQVLEDSVVFDVSEKPIVFNQPVEGEEYEVEEDEMMETNIDLYPPTDAENYTVTLDVGNETVDVESGEVADLESEGDYKIVSDFGLQDESDLTLTVSLEGEDADGETVEVASDSVDFTLEEAETPFESIIGDGVTGEDRNLGLGVGLIALLVGLAAVGVYLFS